MVVLAVAVSILAGFWILALILRFRGLGDAADAAQLFSLPLAVAASAPQLWSWWRSGVADAVVTPEVLARAKEQLALLVAEQWRTESSIRWLANPDPIPVQWRLTDRPDLLDSTANRTVDVLTVASSADVAGLVSEFRSLHRPRLVILGDAGAGKTTLAVQILLELLRTRTEGSPSPVPVLTSFAGWGRVPRAGLNGWLADQIMHDYPQIKTAGFGPHVIRALISHRHILPVLDGLDEIAEEAQERAIDALNRSLDADAQVVITSRTAEFGEAIAAARQKVRSAVVLEPEPLTPPAAADYLERCLSDPADPQWTALLRQLRAAESARRPFALAKVASTPLGLWLIRTGYIATGEDPSELLDRRRFRRPGRLRAHLFDQLIRACVEARPPSDNPADLFRPRNEYDPADVERWLRFLATNMSRLESRDFDWAEDTVELAPPAPRVERFTCRLGERIESVRRWSRRLVARDRRFIAVPVTLILLTLLGPLLGGAAVVLAIWWPARGLPTAPRLIIEGAGLLAAAAVFLPMGVVVLTILDSVLDPDSDAPTLAGRLTRDWYALRPVIVRQVTTGALALSYGLPAAVIGGLTAGLGLGADAGWLTGLAVAVAVSTLVVWQRTTGLAPAADDDADYYLQPLLWQRPTVGRGIRDALVAGLVMGLILSFYSLSIMLPEPAKSWAVPLWFAVLWTAVSWLVLIPLLGLIVPAVLALSRVPSGLAGRALTPGDRPEDAVTLWRHDRIAYGLRFARLTTVAALLAIGAAYAWSALARTPEWAAFHRGGPVDLVSLHPSGIELIWAGRIHYALAVVLALIVAGLTRAWIGRGWLRWLLAVGVAAGTAFLWPRFAEPDDFRIRLASRAGPEGQDVFLDADIAGRLAGLGDGRWRGGSGIGAATLGTPSDWRSVLIAWSVGVAALVAFSVVRAVRPAEVTTWWSTGLATAPHAARGDLPRNLPVFLDDAHRLGLMRAVGNIYQFRHAELQDHLARPT
jgi:NACHT domain-containing protein